MHKTYIVIVNFHTDTLISRAIDSIHETSLSPYVLIVDNEASTHSINALEKLANDHLEVITSQENLGFAGGINLGYKYLKSKFNDIQYLFLLNPDAIATPNVILGLMEVLDSNPYCAAVSPRIFDNKTKENWFSGTMIDFENCKINNNPNISQTDISTIDVFNGCAVLFDGLKFEEAGMFDEETFLYYDEANLSMNFKALQYQCIYAPHLDVYHDVSSSTGNHSFLKSYYMMRNHIYFFKKFKHNCGFCAFTVPIRNFLSSIKHLRLSSAIGIVRGILDYFKNKKGKQI